jgi:hypothetical protein
MHCEAAVADRPSNEVCGIIQGDCELPQDSIAGWFGGYQSCCRPITELEHGEKWLNLAGELEVQR